MLEGKILIVIPTYNEKENIEKLIRKIFEVNSNYHILIVDDNSPDGTSEIVKKLQTEFTNLHLITRSGKLGLGTAYIAGLKYGYQNGFTAIGTMDADFSHSPEYLPAMVELLKKYDIGIGSRYVPGGGTKNWGIHRKILSRCANAFAKFMLGLKSNDNTAGFRLYKREVLEKINLDNIFSNGYSFLVEMIYKCQKAGFKVGETPIIFIDRKEGKSKISKNEIFKAIKTILRLKFSNE
ncbi:MAG TPA: polyprenol monophosphomannose synthase [bacterium]|nr:polyprenol monophosphomannose synthase [bacterium]HOL47256.1 polyprenol monophosphomannose synthase [bacterium]HPQ19292.1 polyprenol monophosphomannose synthase [bacterium]